MNADEVVEIVFVNPTENGKAKDCDCQMRVSDGHGQYSDVYYITPCKKHLSGVLAPQPIEGEALRDMFAAKAMQGIIGVENFNPKRSVEQSTSKASATARLEEIAKAAYLIADAMLKERLNDGKA